MKKNLIWIISCIGTVMLAGCSEAPEAEPIPNPDSEAAEIVPTGWLQRKITGPSVPRMGNVATYTFANNTGVTIKWAFGKIDSNGTFVDMPGAVVVLPTSTTFTYKIVILVKAGTYAVKGDFVTDGGTIIEGTTYTVNVAGETTSPDLPYPREVWIERYQAYKIKSDGSVYYKEGLFSSTPDETMMPTSYRFRTFNGLVSSANPCSKYLIPIYMTPMLGYNMYDIQSYAGSTEVDYVAFYIFRTQLPGTIPVYSIAETRKVTGITPTYVYTNRYLSTENIQRVMGLVNLGVIGYVFPS